MKRILPLVTLSLLSMCFTSHAQNATGGISLGQTRVVFSAAAKTQTLTVSNTSDRAYLIQSRLEPGPDETPAPFIVTPPLFTLKGDSRQLLRIMPQSHTMPADRESLFYLSVTAIPAQAEPIIASDRLSIGLGFVVKLFYRPTGLSVPVETAPCLLTFSRTPQGIKMANPTPYYQTLGALSLNDRPVSLEPQASMVFPYSSLTLAAGLVNHVVWQTVTDYGGVSSVCKQTLTSTERTP